MNASTKISSVSNVVRQAAGNIENMKKVMEEFKDLTMPMSNWPRDRLNDFQKKLNLLNEETKKELRK